MDMANDLEHNTALAPRTTLAGTRAEEEGHLRAQSGPVLGLLGNITQLQVPALQLLLSILCSCVSQALVPISLLSGWSSKEQHQHYLGPQ